MQTRKPATGTTPATGLKRGTAKVNLCLNPTMKARINQQHDWLDQIIMQAVTTASTTFIYGGRL